MINVDCRAIALAVNISILKRGCHVVSLLSQKELRHQEISKQSHLFVNKLVEFAEPKTTSSGVDSRSLEFENGDDDSAFPMKICLVKLITSAQSRCIASMTVTMQMIHLFLHP
jgi:hypothetical protein